MARHQMVRGHNLRGIASFALSFSVRVCQQKPLRPDTLPDTVFCLREADLQPIPESPPPPNELASGWTFRVIPYAWLSGLYGSQTAKGRTVGVNLPFDKLLELTVGKGNLPIALMGDVEARYGPFGIYSDLVWTKADGSGDRVHTHRFAPEITGAVGTAHDVTIRMGIAEAGAMYEITRFTMPHADSPGIPVAIDLIAGARYWYQQEVPTRANVRSMSNLTLRIPHSWRRFQ